mmetsp:Transcript_15737/g.32577  ORF Transcript_15737/g.32577 Transcript_15737/m.32577 type:complete len:225 (+) Transcript_15737:494-1168(+)
MVNLPTFERNLAIPVLSDTLCSMALTAIGEFASQVSMSLPSRKHMNVGSCLICDVSTTDEIPWTRAKRATTVTTTTSQSKRESKTVKPQSHDKHARTHSHHIHRERERETVCVCVYICIYIYAVCVTRQELARSRVQNHTHLELVHVHFGEHELRVLLLLAQLGEDGLEAVAQQLVPRALLPAEHDDERLPLALPQDIFPPFLGDNSRNPGLHELHEPPRPRPP